VIGIGDLLLDLNLTLDMFSTEPQLVASLEKAGALSRKYKKPLAGFIPTATLKERLGLGYRYDSYLLSLMLLPLTHVYL
jgi:hypothetical protein